MCFGGDALPEGAPKCCGCKFFCINCGYHDLTPVAAAAKKVAATKAVVLAAPSVASLFMLAAYQVEDAQTGQILLAVSLMMMILSAILIAARMHFKKADDNVPNLKQPLVDAERGEVDAAASAALPKQEVMPEA